MKAKFKKNWWIYLIVGVLVCAILGGIIYACVGTTNDNEENTKTISASEFSLGGLDENGEYVETHKSIYTKDAFECQGLTVTPKFESQVSYQIFFYDEYGDFVEKTESLEKTYNDEIPDGVTHARIVITPDAKEDGTSVTMNVFNKSKYAKQLTIKVDSEQKDLNPVYYTVTFDSGEGSKVESQQVISGGHPIQPTQPVRATYSFCGWKYNGEYVDFDTFEVNSDVTFVADWA